MIINMIITITIFIIITTIMINIVIMIKLCQEISSTQPWLSGVGWGLIQGRLVLNIVMAIIFVSVIIIVLVMAMVIFIVIPDPSTRGGRHADSRPTYARFENQVDYCLEY